MGKALVFAGLLIAGIGVVIMLGVPLGHLPGDVVHRRGGMTVYLPITKSVVLSIVLTLMLMFGGLYIKVPSAYAWMYGPVFPNLYHALKSWGGGAIHGNALVFESFDWNTPRITTEFASRLIDRVWEIYGPMTGVALSQLTHQQDTPWYKARSANPGARGPEIPNELICEYFKKLLEKNGGG